jgi:hypothetical protein
MRDRAIKEWQDKAGLQPPKPAICQLWQQLQNQCFVAIKVAELEMSGIRDGDGCWSGSDVLDHVWNDLRTTIERLRAAYYAEDSARSDRE